MKQKAILLKIKDNKVDVWKKWCAELEHELKSAALDTLQEERVIEELCVLVWIDEQPYVLGFVEGEALPANLTRELNQRHNEMKNECLEYVSDAKVLYHLKP